MTRPIVLYVDEAYKVLFGQYPPHEMPAQERMVRVMAEWDGRKFESDRQYRIAARLALCQIGLDWHATLNLPYDFELIASRFREAAELPEKEPINGRTLRHTLALHGVRPYRRP